MMLKSWTIAWCLCVITASTSLHSQVQTGKLSESKNLNNGTKSIVRGELGTAKNVHRSDRLYFSDQISPKDFQSIQSQQITRVITFRTGGEVDWDEKGAVKAAGMEFLEIPFLLPDSLTDEVFEKVRAVLNASEQKTLLHCGSANRVGGAWLPYRVLDQGVALSAALAEARVIGLESEAYEAKAIDYIQRMQSEQLMDKEKSVKPGINKNFIDPEMSVEEYVKRFEIESREVYLARESILKELRISPGDLVADVGAGTGLFTRMFAKSVGETGWVFAIDISARFIEHINLQSSALDLDNITGVLCAEDSINLPPQSVDVVFVCDTYHHFEYPKSTLSSIHRALKPGGQFVVIDFDRIPGKSREWLVNHVRAGKDVFRAEIMDAGFVLHEEVSIAGFKENYFLRFRKKK
jgi:cyclopropane fatty-acyl-phospholipid synthase-like methyltransferase/protein tyrosine phosphatase (PTP) superfamily phosphohydrolase (DUF442 family)